MRFDFSGDLSDSRLYRFEKRAFTRHITETTTHGYATISLKNSVIIDHNEALSNGIVASKTTPRVCTSS
jgi:hypothetical protein